MMQNNPGVRSIHLAKALSTFLFVILIWSMVGCGSDDGAPPESSSNAGSPPGNAVDSALTDTKTANQLEAFPQSYVIINDPPGAIHITTGEKTASFGGVSNKMVQLSYTHQTNKQPTRSSIPIDPQPVWRVEALPLEVGDNVITVQGRGTDNATRSDKLTITCNPGFTFDPVLVAPRELDQESTGPVLVSVKIHDPARLAGDIGVFVVDAQGRLAEKALATLNDDGQQGDAVAADGIYSGHVSIDTGTAKTYRLRLKFPVKPPATGPYTAYSEITKVVVYAAFTEQDGKDLKVTMNQVASKYPRLLKAGDSKKEAFSKVAAELKKQDTVLDAVVAEDGQAVWWTMNSGVTLGHTDYPEGTIGGSSAPDPEKKALVWAPFVSGGLNFKGEGAHVNAMTQIFQKFRCPRVKTIETLVDKNARLKRTRGKDILYISSHGGVVPGDPAQSGKLRPGKGTWSRIAFRSPAAGTVYFLVRTTLSWADIPDNIDPVLRKWYRAGKLVILFPRSEEKGGYYDEDGQQYDLPLFLGVTSRFIEDEFPNFPPNSMVHLRTCSSLANITMAEAFLKKGVLAYSGFTDTASLKWANAISETYFDRIRKGDSIDKAAGYAYDKNGYSDPKHPGRFIVVTGDDATACESDCGATLDLSWSFKSDFNADVAPSAEAANMFMKMDHKRDENGTAKVLFREVYKDPEFPNLGKKLIPEGAFSFSARDESKGASGFKGVYEVSGETLLSGSGGDVWDRENTSKDGYGYISLKVYWPKEEVDLDKELEEAKQEAQAVLNDAPSEALANLPPGMLQAMGQMEELQQQMAGLKQHVEGLKPLTDEIKARRPDPKKGQIAYELELGVNGLPAKKVEDGKSKEGTIGSETPISIYRVVNRKSGSYPIKESGELKNGTYRINGTLKISEGILERNAETE